jgi:hypothetical protein
LGKINIPYIAGVFAGIFVQSICFRAAVILNFFTVCIGFFPHPNIDRCFKAKPAKRLQVDSNLAFYVNGNLLNDPFHLSVAPFRQVEQFFNPSVYVLYNVLNIVLIPWAVFNRLQACFQVINPFAYRPDPFFQLAHRYEVCVEFLLLFPELPFKIGKLGLNLCFFVL